MRRGARLGEMGRPRGDLSLLVNDPAADDSVEAAHLVEPVEGRGERIAVQYREIREPPHGDGAPLALGEREPGAALGERSKRLEPTETLARPEHLASGHVAAVDRRTEREPGIRRLVVRGD